MSKIAINEYFEPLLSSNDRYYFLTGGRGSGKSFAVAHAMLVLTFEVGHTILYTRLTMVSANKSIIPEFNNMIEALGLEDQFDVTADQIVNKETGSTIWFMGLKSSSGANTARLKSLSGVTTWVIDEFEDMSQEEALFHKVDESIRTNDMQNRVIMVMNPTTREFWAYDYFLAQNKLGDTVTPGVRSKNDCTFIHTNYLIALEHVSDSWLAKVERTKAANYEEYKHRYLGGWRDAAEGVIFDYHSGSQYDIVQGQWMIGDYEVHSKPTYGMDFGSNDPSVLTEASIDKKNKILYVKTHFFLSGMVEEDVYNKTINSIGLERVIADSSAKMHIEGLRRKGLNILSAKKGPDSVMKGINLLLGYKIVVDENSTSLIREFRNYKWHKTKADYPDDGEGWDHGIDALRYSIFYDHHQKNSSLMQTVY